MKAVTWGVLSVSKHFTMRVHGPLKNSDLTDIAAIASRSPDRAKSSARELNIQKAYGSYEELLADPAIEAVYIPLPNHLHAEWVKKAADAGKHILCEKPFAMNFRETEEAIRYAESKSVKVMEAFMYRFHPQWVRVNEIVRSGEIGDIRFVHVNFAFMNKDAQNIRNILEAGGGALMDLGCYAVSAIRLVMGKEPRRAISLIERDHEFKTDYLSSGILDFGVSRGLFSVSTQTSPGQRVEICGSAGSISIPLPFNMFPDVPAEVSVTTSIGTRSLSLGPVNQYKLLFDGFSRSVREGLPVPTPPADAIANMKVLDAVFRSEKSGSWEEVQQNRPYRESADFRTCEAEGPVFIEKKNREQHG